MVDPYDILCHHSSDHFGSLCEWRLEVEQVNG